MLCPICNSELKKTEHFNQIFNQYNFYCNNCDSFHLEKEQDDLEYYSKNYNDNFLAKKHKKVLKLFHKFFYVQSFFRYKYLKRNIVLSKNFNIIEIGGRNCESYFVFNAREKIKSYFIVEPSKEWNIKSNNLIQYNDLFENIDNDKFAKDIELFMMFHVLEHIYDLDIFFNKLKNINPEYFYFEVPNIKNKKVLINSTEQHPHYHNFSRKSLVYLFEKYGFYVKSIDYINEGHRPNYKERANFFKRNLFKLLNIYEKLDNETDGLHIRAIVKIR